MPNPLAVVERRWGTTLRQALLVWCLAWAVCGGVVATAYATEIRGRVIAVGDGDIVTVLDAQRVQHRVRLQGIDAPELRQPFGQRARQALSDRVFRQEVVVKVDTTS